MYTPCPTPPSPFVYFDTTYLIFLLREKCFLWFVSVSHSQSYVVFIVTGYFLLLLGTLSSSVCHHSLQQNSLLVESHIRYWLQQTSDHQWWSNKSGTFYNSLLTRNVPCAHGNRFNLDIFAATRITFASLGDIALRRTSSRYCKNELNLEAWDCQIVASPKQTMTNRRRRHSSKLGPETIHAEVISRLIWKHAESNFLKMWNSNWKPLELWHPVWGQ